MVNLLLTKNTSWRKVVRMSQRVCFVYDGSKDRSMMNNGKIFHYWKKDAMDSTINKTCLKYLVGDFIEG